jgi:transaldolase
MRLAELAKRGQSVWLDDLSRDLLTSGALAKHLEGDAVVGVTSNPTIFEKALKSGGYDDDFARADADEEAAYLALSGEDVRRACALLRPVYERTGGVDGRVSWELDPALAHDAARSLEQARRLKSLVNAPNLYVKIPATAAGVNAIENSIAEGIDINVTLIFSLERHEAVMESYVRGLERFAKAGGDVSTVHSVASFFVSRVDSEADKRLAALDRPDLQGKLAIANAKLAYQRWRRAFSGARFQSLAARGAHVQRCLWASTSTKNPAYRDVMYVEELIGPDTVTTLPVETLRNFADHGLVADTLVERVSEAERVFEDVRDAGVDYDDVCRVLEREGVRKFAESLSTVLRAIRDRRASTSIAVS